MEIHTEEELMIECLRKVELHPHHVLTGMYNIFKDGNTNGIWDDKLENITEYLEALEQVQIK
ncbi:hypothetical protein [Brevibacillus brevis]|uniref:hypothetical protein n=1 Tax=Brevibacillus brevis TaxID=1393 RepID=UPI0007D8986F|nr:hypothetical protein [Brevibacillus brevis]